MTARNWYQRFCREYRVDKGIKKLGTKGYQIDGKWTPAMMALLRRMGEEIGYGVTQEGSMAGRCRSDQRWVKQYGSGVYIEHENRCDAKIDGEIQKLCNDVSKLKVLITYVGDKRFDDNVREVTEKIRVAMRNYRATFTGELLLVVAGEHEHEWEAHVSELRMEPL